MEWVILLILGFLRCLQMTPALAITKDASAEDKVRAQFVVATAKISTVSARDAYRRDHHRNLFGTDKATPFQNRQESTQWQTSTSNSYAY